MGIGSPFSVLRRALRPTDDAVHRWWPLRLGWRSKGALNFFDWHGWQTGWDGMRGVFGQTFHIGALKVMLGPSREDYSARQAPPVRYEFKVGDTESVRRALKSVADAAKRGSL